VARFTSFSKSRMQFIKFHLLLHLVDSVGRVGAIRHASMEPFERAHRPDITYAVKHINGRDLDDGIVRVMVKRQVACWLAKQIGVPILLNRGSHVLDAGDGYAMRGPCTSDDVLSSADLTSLRISLSMYLSATYPAAWSAAMGAPVPHLQMYGSVSVSRRGLVSILWAKRSVHGFLRTDSFQVLSEDEANNSSLASAEFATAHAFFSYTPETLITHIQVESDVDRDTAVAELCFVWARPLIPLGGHRKGTPHYDVRKPAAVMRVYTLSNIMRKSRIMPHFTVASVGGAQDKLAIMGAYVMLMKE
jgi:hypothetical protein